MEQQQKLGAITYSHHINKNIKLHDVLYVGNYTEKMRILLFSWGKWTTVQPLWGKKIGKTS